MLFILKVTVAVQFGRNLLPTVYSTAMKMKLAAERYCLVPLQPRGHYTYRQFNIHNSSFRPHTLYLCVLCGSENKQLLFPYTTLTVFYIRDGECLLRGTDWVFT